ncbi:MAG: hypothetical protein KIT15_04650 [Xanthobacteraceae bacterium]|nr:hypothetical protein [Xanthobacteraceae bacterium]MCW5673849.1 hypothetical protein [Xanthobacteraceae bacterium]
MARSKLATLTLAVAMAISPLTAKAGVIIVPPVAQASTSGAATFGLVGCVGSIMLAAIDASRRYNRELTTEEAATCGLLYWIKLANLQ